MRPIFKKYTVYSQINGPITVEWRWGQRTLWAGGFEQSGPYATALWRHVLKQLPTTQLPKNVLMLGLGGGSALPVLERAYPGVRVTVIEWDSVMVALARELPIYSTEPTVLVGDICELMPRLNEKFDLVLIDVFLGDDPEPRLLQDNYVRELARLLTPNGFVAMNLSRTLSFTDAFQKHLSLVRVWKYKYNHLALFSPKKWVPGVGLEPTRTFVLGILSPLCLPFHHPGDGYSIYFILRPRWESVTSPGMAWLATPPRSRSCGMLRPSFPNAKHAGVLPP